MEKADGILGFQDKFIETMINLFQEDICYFSKNSPLINDNLFITYRAYGVWGLIVNWIKSDFSMPSEQMAKQLIEIISYRPLQVYNTKKERKTGPTSI